MTYRIGLISDVHCAPQPVAEALAVFDRAGVDRVLCAGDIAGYGGALDETVDLLREHGCGSIYGNHELRYLECNPEPSSPVTDYIRNLPATLELEIEGRSLYMVHASPPCDVMDGIQLLDEAGEVIAAQKHYWVQRLDDFVPDVLVVGHTHQVFAEQLGDTLVINPGSTRFNHTCAVVTFPALSVEVFPLSGQIPVKSWHWKGVE
ncbi:MAG TPA: metallophosphoesterase [Gammaproteobacteria bacterium]|nr:metallophosphoesterase [Gammaproteobacteria bacterium]